MRRIFFVTLMLLVLLVGQIQPALAFQKPVDRIRAFLNEMTPEEKVGQLFLVGFSGTDTDEDAHIYDLIVNRHIGGVILTAANGNFSDVDTIAETHQLISRLQQLEYEGAATDAEPATDLRAAYVPLFIAITQDGAGSSANEIINGLTQLPAPLAIGATWNPSLAAEVGTVMGSELSALGVNLYLGPSLDVVESNNVNSAPFLGANTFGADPYWVGEMGRAYISGLHTGSQNAMLVVAKNFPGRGSADRPTTEEVATVRKSLEQLKQIELAPFFAVTNAVDSAAVADGLLVSHIRYQGFQGNIRSTTRPVSFDATALAQLLSLTEFKTWRDNGGLIFSDNLGSPAVRNFFDPENTKFEAWQVARNAFLAGNDVLIVDDFVASGDYSAYTTLIRTLDFFTQKYQEDAAFAQGVDASVERILAAKLRLYPQLNYNNVIKPVDALSTVGLSAHVPLNVVQSAATLISPAFTELDSILPSPPASSEHIVIFTDVRTTFQCESCTEQQLISRTAFENALLRLYGPQAGGLILQNRLNSFTFSQLTEVLDNIEQPSEPYLADNLKRATWVIFNLVNVDQTKPSSQALNRLLSEKLDLIRDKNVIVFSYGSPIYLDATDISKIAAYYALYSPVSASVEMAARLLMQEQSPQGDLPLSLSSTGYDLNEMTKPHPDQIIGLNLVLPQPPGFENTGTEQPTATLEFTPAPMFRLGDTITIRTDQIYDHNNHPVPDGTVVKFTFRTTGERAVVQLLEATTFGGVATINYQINATGALEVNASSEQADESETVSISVDPSGNAEVIIITPTLQPTETPQPTNTPMPVTTPEPELEIFHNPYPNLVEYALALFVVMGGAVLAFAIGSWWWRSQRWAIRSGLCAGIGGLMGYLYLLLGLRGVGYWMQRSGTGFVIEITIVGMLLGWMVALIWWMRTDGRYHNRIKR